jgi:hypothetical protein
LCCGLILDPEVLLLLGVPKISRYWLAVHVGGAM